MRLVADTLTCERSGRIVFSGLSFAIESGTALAVTGANGAGKSSLLRMVAGLLAPSHGSVTLESGQDDTPLPEQTHYIGHRDALKPALTPYDTLSFWRDYLAVPDTPPGQGRSVDDALDRMGLGHTADLPSAYLSAGQRRRLALARLLVAQRPVWLLDEPTTALDIASQALLWSLCADHLATGGIIMVATHAELGISAQALCLGAARPIAEHTL